MRSDPVKKPYLNLGCGNKVHKEWINIDFTSVSKEVMKYDLLNKFPFEDNSIQYIYHSHLLEHFAESDGIRFTQECYRVLQKDGIIRIVVPDLENIIECYKKLIIDRQSLNDESFDKFHRWIIIELFDQAVREDRGGLIKQSLLENDKELQEFIVTRIGRIEIDQKHRESRPKPLLERIKRKLVKMILTEREYRALNIGLFRESGEIHKWMYDKYSLTRLLFNVGFRKVINNDSQTSYIPDWSYYEFDIKDNVILNPTSLYIEAIK